MTTVKLQLVHAPLQMKYVFLKDIILAEIKNDRIINRLRNKKLR
jgi:hypothetical protein